MMANWLNALGDRNPQLLRELRGRLQWRSVIATTAIVVVGQLLLLAFFAAMLPNTQSDSQFCLGVAEVGCRTDWQRWWQSIFAVLAGILPYALYVPGAYALVNDMIQEMQKGTLNFLRLSPRSSQNILLGKLLGVPILGYFSFLLLLPLQLISGVLGGVPIGELVMLDATILLWGALLFTMSIFIGFSSGGQTRTLGVNGASGLGAVALVVVAGVPAIGLIKTLFLSRSTDPNRAVLVPIRWFGALVNQDWSLAHLFIFGNIVLLTYWFWRVLQRTFRKPTATLLSKRQGYAIVTYVLLLVMGFLVPGRVVKGDLLGMTGFTPIAIVASIAMYAALPLIFALSTPRQTLLDWCSGRQELAIAQRAANVSPGKRRLEQIRDRLLGDKSPGVTAILICVLIAYGLISLLLPVTKGSFGIAVLGLSLSATLVANYALLVQLMLLLETAQPFAWAVGSLVCAIVLPGLCVAIPGLNLLAGYFTPGLWFLLYDSATRGTTQRIESGGVVLALLAWGLLMGLLIMQGLILRYRLRQLGRSV
ncbi:MAG: hypothetical protein RLZZ511_168 [Cyanobacteriota bacterium]|jgi:hypothetical protein